MVSMIKGGAENMCYIVVKRRNSSGCCAFRTKHGKALVALKKKITGDELQVVTISKPAAYGEYAPYTFAHSEEELLELVNKL